MAALARIGCTEAAVAKLSERARSYADEARAAATVRAYESDLADFRAWCEQHGFSPLPAEPQTVALYLTERADTLSVASLRRRLAGIAVAHRLAGLESPTTHGTVKSVLRGVTRIKGAAQTQKVAITTEQLRTMIGTLPESLLGCRDRALLLIGFAGAFRRSELVAFDVRDVQFVREGVLLQLRKSKTDQEQVGRTVAIPFGSNPVTCPVRSLAAWIEAAGLTDGPLFRSVNRHGQVQSQRLTAQSVALVVKRYARNAGFACEDFAGHSLRSGFCTSAAEGGAGEREIMQQSGHKSITTARKYIRKGTLWQNHAGYRVGL
jgi:site-specific recombinase XerD